MIEEAIQIQTVMSKPNLSGVANMQRRRKRNFQEYFDTSYGTLLTPNQRVPAQDRKLFKGKPKGKSSKKEGRRNLFVREKENDSPRPHRQHLKSLNSRSHNIRLNQTSSNHRGSHHQASRLEQSLNRQYDSPSREQDEMDFILQKAARVQGKGQGRGFQAETIERVNGYLGENKLTEAIFTLKEALMSHSQNYQLVYLLGICYIFKGDYYDAINIFTSLLRAKPTKNIYLLLSVCFKKTEDYPQTQAVLQECISKFPKYYEAYIYRGKLYLKLKQHKKALFDFEKAVTLQPHKQIGLIGKGDCLRLMERYEEAKVVYTQACNSKKNGASLLLRKAICSMELKRYEAAIEDINKLLAQEQDNSEALYFKGLILNKLKQQNEAIICYEQAIKFNTNKRAITRSIYELAKIKIENRDYYEALYTLERAQHLDIDERVVQKFRIFTDGVTSMMKKNYAQGVKVLSELVADPEKPLSNFLKPLFYSTRSFGFLAQKKFLQAKDDLEQMEKEFALDLPNLYNKFICEGVLACNSQKYEQALALFSKAGKALPNRLEPAYYKAVTLISFATRLIPKDLKDKRKEYLESAMRTIAKVEAIPIESNPSLFLVRGMLRFAVGDNEGALEDLEKSWKENPEPNPLVSYLIGLIFGESGKYDEAIHQFKRTISHDEKPQAPEVPQAYLARAKCLLLTGDVNGGFVDLQAYMSFRPSSPQIHIWAGHLLFFIGAYEDAAKAYSNINNINRNFQVLGYRAHCYLTSKDVLNSINNMKLMLEVKYDSKTYFDFNVLKSLQECSEENMDDYGKIRQALKDTRRKCSIGDSNFGNIFKESDYQFFKGVMYFYEQNYASAAKNFKRALDLAELQIEQEGEADSNLLDFYKLTFTNRTFNSTEIVYNMAICEILFGNLAKANKLLKSLIQKVADGGIKDQLQLFVHLLTNQIARQFSRDKHVEDEEQAQFMPFPSENRLCEIFPEVILPFSTAVRTKIFFCLPYVAKPDITPRFDEKILEELTMASIEIKPEAPWIRRSEQGIIFTDEVIKYDIELSSSSSEEEEEEEQGEQDEQYEQYEREDERHSGGSNFLENREEDDQFEEPMNPNQFKERFKLDKSVEQKLARLNLNRKE